MILFNLILFKESTNSFQAISSKNTLLETYDSNCNQSVKRTIPLAYTVKNLDLRPETYQILAKKKAESTGIRKKVLNTLWSQDVFLSLNNKSWNKYTVQLNSLNINKGENAYKSLLAKFSKSLFDGSIQVSLTSHIHHSHSSFFTIQYFCARFLQLQSLKIQGVFQKSVYRKKMSEIQNLFNETIKLDHVPLFAISNHLGQMIIAEPPTDLTITNYIKPSSITKTYYSNIYHGFFFANYEDAQEYLAYIVRYYNLKGDNLKIFACNASTFYKVMHKFDNSICFKLIPDLKEVSSLIKQYRYSRHLSFDKRQKFGKNFFQGQPVYLVKKGNNILSHTISQENEKEHNLLFMNYQDAIRVYKKIRDKNLLTSSKKITLVAYNLECFIRDQLKAENSYSSPFFVIPARNTYTLTKESQLKNFGQLFRSNYLETVSSINLWSKRIFWSLTSKKPSAYF